MSRSTPSPTSNQPQSPVTPTIGAKAIAYISVVHGRKTRPSSGTQKLSNAWVTSSVKIHARTSAIRGPIETADGEDAAHGARA